MSKPHNFFGSLYDWLSSFWLFLTTSHFTKFPIENKIELLKDYFVIVYNSLPRWSLIPFNHRCNGFTIQLAGWLIGLYDILKIKIKVQNDFVKARELLYLMINVFRLVSFNAPNGVLTFKPTTWPSIYLYGGSKCHLN